MNGLVLIGLLWGVSVLIALGWYGWARWKLRTEKLSRLDLFRRAKVGGKNSEE